MTTRLIRRAGFTLVELLVVVGIMMVLLSLVGMVAQNARAKARVNRARALVKQIHLVVEQYRASYREYPPTQFETYPNVNYVPGVELDSTWLKDWEASFKFNKDDFDPADPKYFIDPWKHRIRYRKSSPERILIWSIGPPDAANNFVDVIGTDATGRKERGGTNITNVDADY
jgi:type II secretory pathway pseudopilin PulG